MSSKSVALVGDKTEGVHEGKISGTIITGSSKLRVGGIPVAVQNSSVEEKDGCGTTIGSITGASSKVKVGGKPIARLGDTVTSHHGGTSTIITACDKVKL